MAKKIIWIIIVICIVTLGLFLFKDLGKKTEPISDNVTPAPTVHTSPVARVKATPQQTNATYYNNTYGFSFMYPGTYVLRMINDSDGVMEKNTGKIEIHVLAASVYMHKQSNGCGFSFTDSMYALNPAFCELKREDFKIGTSQGGFSVYRMGSADAGASIQKYVVLYKKYAIEFKTTSTHSIASQPETQQEQQANRDAREIALSLK